jgi:hypothetical protein
MAIVKVVPLAVEGILGKRCVMTEPDIAIVITHAKAVVDKFRVALLSLAKHEGAHV